MKKEHPNYIDLVFAFQGRGSHFPKVMSDVIPELGCGVPDLD